MSVRLQRRKGTTNQPATLATEDVEGNPCHHSALLPFTMPGPQSLPSPCRVDLGRGTGWEDGGERADASVAFLGAGVGRESLSRPSSVLAFSWVSPAGLLGIGGLGGVWETGAPLQV